MKVSHLIVLAATLHVANAFAQAYGGIAIGSRGTQHWRDPATGINLSPAEREWPIAGYAGYRIDDAWAVEAGYARLTDSEYATSAGRAAAESNAAYVAARRRWAITDALGWYVKAGVAYNTLRIEPPAGGFEKEHAARPMAALGMDYRFAPNVAATAEVAGYGKVKTRNAQITHTTVQLGLRFDF
jgi:opacity protein-like surface antigen